MPTSSGGTTGRGGRRGTLFLVTVLLVVQFVSWRGTYKLKANSLSTEWLNRNILIKRQILEDPVNNVIANNNLSFLGDNDIQLTNKKEDKKEKKKEKEDKKHNKKEKKRKDKDKKKQHSSSSSTLSSSSTKSKEITTSSTKSGSTTATPHCSPLPTESSPQNVCEHVRQYCPPTGHLNYLEFFYCIGVEEGRNTETVNAQATPTPSPYSESKHVESKDVKITKSKKHIELTYGQKWLRAIALALIVGWMLFLFSWVGIVASDFFCPNLSTLAARLGLSESTAGVTFLAFGNGSPDVFSTFGAMRTGSGSLAIGELIGAASFIVSVISGSMMLIAPFRVKPYPFTRDVGFFTVAVSMTMTYLMDGKLLFSECLSMIALYVLYAATIIIGSWWQERRRQKRVRMANIRSEHSTGEQTYESLSETEGQTYSVQAERSPRLGPFSAVEYEPDVDPFTQWANQQDAISNGHPSNGYLTPLSGMSASHSPLLHPIDLPTASSGGGGGSNTNTRLLRFRAGVLARHSLLGAVEFRDVVRTLQQESSTDRSMEIFQSRDPERYLPHPQHSHLHHLSQDEAIDRRHMRTKSLTRPYTARASMSPSGGFRASLVRSRSTVGSSADAGAMTDVVRPTLEQIGQRSGLPTTAVAVDDPWKEHDPLDGCETQSMLPPSALPLLKANEGDDDDQAAIPNTAQVKPVLPRLAIRQATMTSNHDRMKRQDSKKSLNSSDVHESQPFESPFASKEAFVRAVQRTRRALFPSLRHFREKSWLGIFVGIVTAPAILLLRLTLPVVDDSEEENLVREEKKSHGGSQSGQIRLAGEESPLLVHQRSYLRANENDEEDDENEENTGGRGVIDLTSTHVDDPWNSSIEQREGADDEGEESNRQRQLHVASALRNLPEEGSPLLNDYNRHSHTLSPNSNFSRNASHQKAKRTPSITESIDSCHSEDSHISSPTQNLFLIVAQCAFAPPFCVWAITSSAHSSHVMAKTIFTLFCGLGLATVVLFAVMHRRHSGSQSQTVHPALISASGWARVAAGFFVSILYIMTIVDEVVSILQTLGLVLGLSDAILGLTVFAMGNSLGDLVANITIAKMGHPVMAISACFAGPLLNLLLGIGISGSWLLSRTDNVPSHTNQFSLMRHEKQEQGIYHIDFSPTLTVSGFGLLLILVGTLIMVPLNGFYLSRKIGSTLIITYIIIMCVNIGVEVYSLHNTLYAI
ncbi:hypothetical protein L7F22_003029 [Adiantum nelumboides]|nr:hypothetical protein [Adiantum nelumboides]